MELQLDRKLSTGGYIPRSIVGFPHPPRRPVAGYRETFQRMGTANVADMNSEEAINLLLKNMKGTKDNAGSLTSMNG